MLSCGEYQMFSFLFYHFCPRRKLKGENEIKQGKEDKVMRKETVKEEGRLNNAKRYNKEKQIM